MSEQSQAVAGAAVAPGEKKPRRRRRSPNYVLEQLLEQELLQRGEGEKANEPPLPIWQEVRGGFPSPEQVLAFVEENKLKGFFRAIRQASPVVQGSMIQADPVYSLKKADPKGE